MDSRTSPESLGPSQTPKNQRKPGKNQEFENFGLASGQSPFKLNGSITRVVWIGNSVAPYPDGIQPMGTPMGKPPGIPRVPRMPKMIKALYSTGTASGPQKT